MSLFVRPGLIALSALCTVAAGFAQNVPIYSGQLINGFNNWSWCTVNISDKTYTYSGLPSAGITYTGAWQGFQLETSPFPIDPFASLSFYINGGPVANRSITVSANVNGVGLPGVNLNNYVSGGSVAAKSWRLVSIPVTALGLKAGDRITELVLQEASGGAQPEFWVADMQWNEAAPPAGVAVTVDTTKAVRTVDFRHFGINLAVYDSILDTTKTKQALAEAGYRMFRFPGGSLSDTYHWQTDRSDGDDFNWQCDFDQFANAIGGVNGQSFITTNYGSGTPAEAAGWVTYSKSKAYGYKYWEVGNECYGSWENDTHARPNDPFTYGNLFAQYATQMRAADGTIKVGAVAAVGEDSFANYTDHPATNPVTGVQHNGWTPVMLATMAQQGVYPDFIVYHRYPEASGEECDFAVLQGGYTWASDIADLRQQLVDYLGAKQAAKIEIVCDENNTGGSGKQTVSLVEGLFLADSFGNVLNTECNAYCFWDLFNGQDTNGNMGSWIYGWRMYEDGGQLDGEGNPYPQYYVQKLLSKYAAPGDTVLTCTSANILVSGFAVKKSDGSVALLLINKHPTATIPVQMSINAALNRSAAMHWSYGIGQDLAASHTGGSATNRDIIGQALSHLSPTSWVNLAPYSANVIIFSPIGTAGPVQTGG